MVSARGVVESVGFNRIMAQHVPAVVLTQQAPLVEALPLNQHLKLAINLPTRNQAELDDLLLQLADPQSPNFHKYLSVDEFTQRFAPTEADYNEVASWAAMNGMSVSGTTPNRRIVDIEGSVENINRTFHVTMNSYQHPLENRKFFSPDREPTVDVAVPVLQVTGMNNYVLPHTKLKKPDLLRAAAPIANATGSGPSGEYLPSDMRAAYYGSGSLTGAGQSIGIFSFDGYLANDVTLFYSNTGMSSSVPIHNVLVAGYNGVCVDPSTGNAPCDDGEQILDIVNAIGMAPGITQIQFYEGDSDTDILNRMATDNTSKILSCSWGWSPADASSDDPIFQEFAAQGQSFVNATGDSGQFNSSTYDFPSVDQYIVQVGGTDLTTSGAGGAWSSETGWPDSGGGNVSGTPIPSWQQLAGVINSSNKGSTTLRNAPDVAMEANFDNPTVSNGTFQTGFGGTSFAAPRWAGFLALVNQQSIANGNGPVGFINPSIYNIGIGSTFATNFHDITSGNNKPTAGSGSGFNAVAGYDLVTGWGSPKAALITALAGGATATADFSLSAAPSSLSVAQGSSGTSTITVNKLNGFSSSVALAASGLPTGVTASFSPASATTSSVVTFTASASATTGTKSVTITGTWGSLSHTTSVSLNVTATTAANFALSASPSSVSVAQSANATSTISVAPSGGFAGSVSLAASGLPSGVTASFSPTSTTSSSVLTLSASATAATGAATVTITGTSGTLSHSTSIALTVNATGGNVLSNGVAVTGLHQTTGNTLMYTMVVPANATNLKFVMSGGTGDADMYVKFGSAPTLSSYDCRPYVTGNSETCTIATAQAGTYYVMLNAYSGFTGVSLTGSFTVGTGGNVLSNGVPITGLSGTSGNLSADYTFVVPTGATNITIAISGGTGDADMYVRLNSAPTLSTYTCRPYVTGNNESCSLSGAGTYHVKLNAYSTYSGVSLVGSYTP